MLWVFLHGICGYAVLDSEGVGHHRELSLGDQLRFSLFDALLFNRCCLCGVANAVLGDGL